MNAKSAFGSFECVILRPQLGSEADLAKPCPKFAEEPSESPEVAPI